MQRLVRIKRKVRRSTPAPARAGRRRRSLLVLMEWVRVNASGKGDDNASRRAAVVHNVEGARATDVTRRRVPPTTLCRLWSRRRLPRRRSLTSRRSPTSMRRSCRTSGRRYWAHRVAFGGHCRCSGVGPECLRMRHRGRVQWQHELAVLPTCPAICARHASLYRRCPRGASSRDHGRQDGGRSSITVARAGIPHYLVHDCAIRVPSLMGAPQPELGLGSDRDPLKEARHDVVAAR